MREPIHEYHSGERTAQGLAGLGEEAEQVRGIVGTTIPQAAQAFLADRRVVYLAAADEHGRVWATFLAGSQGFTRAVADDRIRLTARPSTGDPLAPALARPTKAGLLAIDPEKRRRMRLNGRMRPEDGGLSLEADEVYANCPKYIQQRTIEHVEAQPASGGDAAATRTQELTDGHRRLIAAADTFFIATRSGAGDADCSHRGGNPGFVHVVDRTTLRFPDYVGNAMLMTLGNLLEDPGAGLLLVDWGTGTTLQLTGTATIDWSPANDLPGSQRSVTFHVEAAVERPHAMPLLWSAPSYSKHNPMLVPDLG